MVAAISRERTPAPLTAARDALAKLQTPRKKTEPEQKLDEILRELHSQKSNAAKEAARRKLERIKAKLEALKLAAGSAAATGDARLARRVAKDIRDTARELGRALADAGGGSASAAAASAGAAAEKAEGSTTAGDTTANAATAAGERTRGTAAGDDLAMLKNDAAGLAKELKKIMRKLRETGLHPHLGRKDRAEMEKLFAETDRELAGLLAAAAPAPGMAVNISA